VAVAIDRRRNIDAAPVLLAELAPLQLIAALFVSPILHDVSSAADLSRFYTVLAGARSASLHWRLKDSHALWRDRPFCS
jgi:hypothetical protein